jgi:anti-sigma factor (TIGR02949 family)
VSKKKGKKKPHSHSDMNCDDAVEHLYGYLDGELTADTETAVRGHLEDCTGCFGQFEFERSFLRFLEARAKAQCAPEPLKRRVFEQILLDRSPEAQ